MHKLPRVPSPVADRKGVTGLGSLSLGVTGLGVPALGTLSLSARVYLRLCLALPADLAACLIQVLSPKAPLSACLFNLCVLYAPQKILAAGNIIRGLRKRRSAFARPKQCRTFCCIPKDIHKQDTETRYRKNAAPLLHAQGHRRLRKLDI